MNGRNIISTVILIVKDVKRYNPKLQILTKLLGQQHRFILSLRVPQYSIVIKSQETQPEKA